MRTTENPAFLTQFSTALPTSPILPPATAFSKKTADQAGLKSHGIKRFAGAVKIADLYNGTGEGFYHNDFTGKLLESEDILHIVQSRFSGNEKFRSSQCAPGKSVAA